MPALASDGVRGDSSAVKRQLRREGAVVAIDLGDGAPAFAGVLEEPLFAFYDLRAEAAAEPDVQRIVRRPVLWRVWVMNRAITKNRWTVIGNVPLDDDLRVAPMFFKQDTLTGDLSLYHHAVEVPATVEECLPLE